MPNLTVSADIDSFMQSANKAAAVASLGALSTAQIAGLSTTAPAALSTTAVVGLSTFAARADHRHVFPTAAEVGALSTSVLSGLATTAPAALATAPVVGLSTFVARADHQHTPLPAGTQYEFFEHFLSSSTPFSGGMASSNSGGTITTNSSFSTIFGAVSLQTQSTVSADQRAAFNTAPTGFLISGTNTEYYLATSLAQASAGWFSGSSTGFLRFGLLSIVAQTGIAEPASGVYFRATNSNAIEFVTRNGNVETSTSTGVSLVNGTFNKYEILINAAASQVIARINGSVVATHTTNIPSSSNRVGIVTTIQRVTADANNYIAAVDWVYFKATPSASWI